MTTEDRIDGDRLMRISELVDVWGMSEGHWRAAIRSGAVPSTLPSVQAGYLVRADDARAHVRAIHARHAVIIDRSKA